jgi:hypothetical protein
MTGVSISELIKYPKNPKGLCIPSTAINKQNTTYMKRKIIEPMLYLDSPNVNERSPFTVHRAFIVHRSSFGVARCSQNIGNRRSAFTGRKAQAPLNRSEFLRRAFLSQAMPQTHATSNAKRQTNGER